LISFQEAVIYLDFKDLSKRFKKDGIYYKYMSKLKIVQVKAVKDFAREKGVRISQEFYEELDNKVISLLEEASKRCKANKRQTIMCQDC
jgi:histone H3/H4